MEAKQFIVVVLGASGAGKDTVAGLLRKHIFTVNKKFSRPFKAVLEEWYNLPVGTLDKQEGKAEKLPGTEFTFSDLLVKSYHFWLELDPSVFPRFVCRETAEDLKNGSSVVFTDMRTVEEAAAVQSLYFDNWYRGVDLKLLFVYGRGQVLSSDTQQLNIIKSFGEIDFEPIYLPNFGTMEELDYRVQILTEGWLL